MNLTVAHLVGRFPVLYERALLEHPEKWAGMGKSGRAVIESRYDIRRPGAKLVRLYHETQ